MGERDYVGLAAVILAVCLGLGWATAVVIAATPWGPELNEQSAQLFNGIGQVLAGALAAFLGARIATAAARTDPPARRRQPPTDTTTGTEGDE